MKLLGKGAGKYVVMAALLFFAAGCNSSGVSGADGAKDGFAAPADEVSPMATSFELPSNDTFGAFNTSEGSDAFGALDAVDASSDSSGTTVAKVHNPEPASMALMGIGLLGLIRRRKKGADVKGLLSILAVIAVLFMGSTSAFAASFVNGGFEDGTFTGWTQGGGWWTDWNTPTWPINPASYQAGAPAGVNPNTSWPYHDGYDASAIASAIVTPGDDPIVGNLLNRVYNGGYSARINDWNNNYSVSTISQKVNNYTDSNIYFEWAAVLQGSHDLEDSDNFTLTLKDLTIGDVLFSRSYSSASAEGIFNDAGNGWFYSPWAVESFDLAGSGRVGHDFELSLLASDCPYGGHAGYVYLDGFAPTVVDQGPGDGAGVPEPASMILMGIGLAGAAMRKKRA